MFIVSIHRNHCHDRVGFRSKTYPETSLTISLTNAVLLLKWPFMRETRGLGWRGVTFCTVAPLLALHFPSIADSAVGTIAAVVLDVRGQH